VAAFRHGLSEIRLVEGQNVAIEFRWAEGDYGRQETLAVDPASAASQRDCRRNGSTAMAAKKVPRGTIPLVFRTGQDPVKDGLVAGFDRPGGDATESTFSPLSSGRSDSRSSESWYPRGGGRISDEPKRRKCQVPN
jgi:putative ABC transport system substrate-binding protein